MTEFWEASFTDKQTMWGFAPADSAIKTAELFAAAGHKNILVPGYGYGRNAHVFTQKGMNVSGIEISQTAIELARKHFGQNIQIFHGSVNDMPFDQKQYDAIFCYSLLHLLDEKERAKLLSDCFAQLKPGGQMVFVTLSTKDKAYGQGEFLSKNHYHTKHGVNLYFHDEAEILNDFSPYGLIKHEEIQEPSNVIDPSKAQSFWMVVCRK